MTERLANDLRRYEIALDRIAELVQAYQSNPEAMANLATWRLVREIEQTATEARRGGRA